MIAGAVLSHRTHTADRSAGVVMASFEDAYAQHADRVYRYCLAQLGNRAAAEDAAAEAFARAFRAWDRAGIDDGMVRPWLFRIARNTCTDHHRAASRRRRLHALIHPGPAVSVEADAELRTDLRRVVNAAAGLRPRERALVGMRLAAGLGFAEIGAVLGMSETAARTATHRAVAHLRARVEQLP